MSITQRSEGIDLGHSSGTLPHHNPKERWLRKAPDGRFLGHEVVHVTVQHVSVSEGGQAIVGNVTQAAARETALEKAANSPPALSNAQERPMEIIGEAERAPVASRRRKDDGRSPA